MSQTMQSTYYNDILNSLSQGILYIDLQGIVTTYNYAAEAILGVTGKEVLHKSFWDNFDDDFFGFSMRSAISGSNIKNSIFATIKSDSQSKRRLEIHTTFITHKQNHRKKEICSRTNQGLIVLIRDISDIRRSEIVDSRSDKMTELSEMAAMVAHEIRNPLGGIKGFASLLHRDLAEHPELQRLAAYIVEGTESLNHLVSDILDYSHTMELTFKPVDLVLLMQDLILHLNADESVDPRIELRTHSSKAVLNVPVDAAGLKSAILNLTSNAIQAMPEGGELLIDVDANENQAIIRVTDTGIGIPKENIDKIFSPFFTTRAKGHGLGLSEAHKIIQAHGGQLEVESECGVGTTFTIKLPMQRKIVTSAGGYFRRTNDKVSKDDDR